MNRPGTEAYLLAVNQAGTAWADLAQLPQQVTDAWNAAEPDQVHARVGRARGTIQSVIAKLEKVDKELLAMRDAILNGEPQD